MPPRTIGVIKAAALGDTILLSAVLTDLKAAFPEARLVLFAGSTNAGLAREFAGVDQVIELPLRRPWAAVAKLRAARCDWMIDADAWPRISALWAVLSGARWVIGFRTAGQKRHYAFDQFVDHDPGVHELANYRHLLRALNVKVGAPPQNPRRWLAGTELPAEFRARRSPFAVVLHFWPGGTKSAMKEWPAEFWTELMARIARDPRWMFVLSGGPADRPRIDAFLAALPAALRERVYHGGGLSLNASLAVLGEAQALISVNTGILHLGAAMEVPVLGLHGATNPRRWGPVGDKHVSVLSAHPAAACLNLGFEYPAGDPPIMAGLTVDAAFAGWRELVRKNDLDFLGGEA